MSLPMRLKAKNLSCERGGRTVFQNLDFEIGSGEFAELRGPNGAGKSSLLRLLAGLNVPESGTLVFEGGKDEATIAEQAHYIGHSEANKPALTVQENLKFWSELLGESFNPNATSIFNLSGMADDQALLLSAGQKRRLALTRLVLAHRPIWLLDEPSVGLDAASIILLQNQIAKHVSSGGMVIAATHTDLGIAATRSINLGGEHLC
jgi:heme exporter protein A